MKIEKVKIEKIKAAEYNPRKISEEELEKLKHSIDEFDYVDPIVWNKRTGNVVGGHQRLKILQLRGDKEIEVSVVDVDENTEKRLNIALNGVSGDWDLDLIQKLIDEDGNFSKTIEEYTELDIDMFQNNDTTLPDIDSIEDTEKEFLNINLEFDNLETKKKFFEMLDEAVVGENNLSKKFNQWINLIYEKRGVLYGKTEE